MPDLSLRNDQSSGFENSETIIKLFQQKDSINIKEYFAKYPTWNCLYENISGHSLWYFIPGKRKQISAEEAIRLSISTEGTQTWTITFPEETMLMDYINQLAESKEFSLNSQVVINGTQHFRYMSKEIVIEIGQHNEISNYLILFTISDYLNKGK